jgi:hypothetical protein
MFGTTVALLGLLTLAPCRALAWHGPGHMTVTKIAYEELKTTDPQLLVTMAKLLKKHPHYDEFLSQDRPDNVSADEWAFVRAATWSDWVRPPKDPTPHQQEIADKYNRPKRHFINYPFVVPPDEAKEQQLQPKVSPDSPEPGNALEAIALTKATLMNAGASDEDKAVSLCWLLHLVGDIHQPLHCAMLVSPKLHGPHYDEGGNLLLVKPAGAHQVTNLHSYWDALVLHDDPDYAAVDAAAQKIRRANQYTRQALTDLLANGKATDWAKESFELAKTVAYMNGTIKVVPAHEGGDHPLADVPVLSPDYEKQAEEIGEKRLALGGYRLADELKAIFKAP